MKTTLDKLERKASTAYNKWQKAELLARDLCQQWAKARSAVCAAKKGRS